MPLLLHKSSPTAALNSITPTKSSLLRLPLSCRVGADALSRYEQPYPSRPPSPDCNCGHIASPRCPDLSPSFQPEYRSLVFIFSAYSNPMSPLVHPPFARQHSASDPRPTHSPPGTIPTIPFKPANQFFSRGRFINTASRLT